ncbi:hypothetical protein OC725_02880 ['Bituminaria bituminosa' little leaf phytoplasma]|uniref:Uncharacterized protein n=2 Tax=Candidatus Phytoplasma fabacearum TaxID=2982628 RepID=A0ABU8ZU93_9MOLU
MKTVLNLKRKEMEISHDLMEGVPESDRSDAKTAESVKKRKQVTFDLMAEEAGLSKPHPEP